MSGLFQPSGLLISEKRSPKLENGQPSNTASSSGSSFRISGRMLPPVSKIPQLKSSTAGEKSQEVQKKTNIFRGPLTSKTGSKFQTTKIKTAGEKKIQNVDKTSFREDEIPKTKMGAGSISGTRKPVVIPIPSPSLLRKEFSLHIKSSKTHIAAQVETDAKGAKVASLKETLTPSGRQQLLDKVITEKIIERTKNGEVVARNLRTIRKDVLSEETIQIEQEFQKFNPDFPSPKGLVKEIVSVVSERDFPASYDISRKNIIQETTKLNLALGINLDKMEHLVEEEKEDIAHIIENAAPELANRTSELFTLKKRLQHLRFSTHTTRLLAESPASQPINAALPLPDASPELIATIMDTSEKAPNSSIPTEQLFNSLFPFGGKESPIMVLSSATPGPIEDVVIPTVVHRDFLEAMLSSDMEQVSTLVHLTDQRPPQDGFSKLQPSQPRRRGRRRRPYEPFEEEYTPLSNEALLVSIEAVGARPSFSLHASNVFESACHGTLRKETSKGIEYILDCQPQQYMSKVQLRGSHPPPWFPGYMVALSNMSGSVALAKSPSEVLLSAWKSVQPEVFSDDSIVYN